jgi:hypothetical protein
LLASLTDNFAGVVAHRQTSPESRDWLAKLMGTRSLWQMTSQTGAHGHTHTGRGSARRVREFRISSDTFGSLSRGEAVIYTPIAGARSTTTLRAHRAQAPSASTRDANKRGASASEPDTDRSAHSSRRWPANHEMSTPGARAPRAKQRPPARSSGACTAATSS